MNNKEKHNSILSSIRNMPSAMNHIIVWTSLALMLSFSSCDKKEKSTPKKIGDFEWVDQKKEWWEERDIYKYTMKKWDYPLSVANNFNKLDDTKTEDVFIDAWIKNILDAQKKEINKSHVYQIGEQIYIKVKKHKEKESEYIYKFSKPDNYTYRKQRETTKGIKKIEKEVLIDGKKEKVNLIEDAWLVFYVVEESDFFSQPMIANGYKIDHCIDFEKISKKLSQIDDFSYLKEKEYQRSQRISDNKIVLKNKLYSFNINPADIEDISKKQIKKWNLFLPIPTPESERSMEIQEFAYYAQQAIEEIQNNSYYGKTIKELVSKVTKEEILEELLTFAYSESSPYGEEKIGKYELHRWEGNHKVFSFSYFHILMTKWSPWYKARVNLWLSEGECYHPKNATKLFLAFRAEKAEEMSKPLSNFFPLNNDMYKKVARTYNWWNYRKNRYDTKMETNHKMVLRKLKEYKKDN